MSSISLLWSETNDQCRIFTPGYPCLFMPIASFKHSSSLFFFIKNCKIKRFRRLISKIYFQHQLNQLESKYFYIAIQNMSRFKGGKELLKILVFPVLIYFWHTNPLSPTFKPKICEVEFEPHCNSCSFICHQSIWNLDFFLIIRIAFNMPFFSIHLFLNRINILCISYVTQPPIIPVFV